MALNYDKKKAANEQAAFRRNVYFINNFYLVFDTKQLVLFVVPCSCQLVLAKYYTSMAELLVQ